MTTRLLVAERDEDLGREILAVLSAAGMQATLVRSIEEAVERASRGRVDAALLDLELANGDTAVLWQELRRTSPDVVVVFMTRSATVEQVAAAVRAEAYDILLKPLRPAQVVESVTRALERARKAHEAHQRSVAGRLDAVQTLAAGLAHEIHNPLNSALLQLALAKRKVEASAPEVLSSLQAVEGELHRLSKLVREFSTTLTPGPLERKRCAVAPLIKRVLSTFRAPAAEREITIHAVVEPGLPQVSIDRARIADALGHLVENAIDASPKGAAIEIEARRRNGEVEIEVADSGPGVSELSRIFDPFFTTKPGSTGLGLTIVYRTMLEHGGQVRVSSREGRTRFMLSLPAA